MLFSDKMNETSDYPEAYLASMPIQNQICPGKCEIASADGSIAHVAM